eukprot:c29256_g1_i1 orf=532-855(+)
MACDEFHEMTEAQCAAIWYILDGNQQYLGPYTIHELQDHYESGYLTDSTLLWANGKSEWNPLSSIPELSAFVITQGSELGDLQSDEIPSTGQDNDTTGNIEMASSIA